MPDKLGAEYSCSLCSSLLQPRLFATSETRRGLVAKCVPQLFPESLPGTRRSAIRHFYISHNAPYLPPAPCPKFCITYVFHFSWLLQPSQEEIENNAYAIFFFFFWGGGGKVHYGKFGSGVLAIYFPVPCNCPSSFLVAKVAKS